MTDTHGTDKQKQAPAELIHNGEYSDRRWVEMMAGHHAMAVEMAKVAHKNSTRNSSTRSCRIMPLQSRWRLSRCSRAVIRTSRNWRIRSLMPSARKSAR